MYYLQRDLHWLYDHSMIFTHRDQRIAFIILMFSPFSFNFIVLKGEFVLQPGLSTEPAQ